MVCLQCQVRSFTNAKTNSGRINPFWTEFNIRPVIKAVFGAVEMVEGYPEVVIVLGPFCGQGRIKTHSYTPVKVREFIVDKNLSVGECRIITVSIVLAVGCHLAPVYPPLHQSCHKAEG